MKALITFLFWGSVFVGGMYLFISSLFGVTWALTLPAAIVSPALFIGLAIGSARRH